jgi:hypothetical protein
MTTGVFRIAVFGVVAVLCAGPAPAMADDATALMARHAAYVGWHAGDGIVKSLREIGEQTRDGKVRASLRSLHYGIAYRDTFVGASGLHFDDGFTGSVAWTSNENGFTVRALGEVVRSIYDEQALFGELTAATASFTPAVLRTQKVATVDCTVVRLTTPVGFPMDVYVDPATGAYQRAVIDPGGKYEESYDGLAYTEVDGKRFLSGWRFGDSKERFTYTKVEPNAAITADELRPPNQTASWTFGDAPATVEYVDAPAPRLYVDLVVNGVKGKFILDTGAADTVMVDSFARKAGAERFGTTAISGIGEGVAKANQFRVATIAVGGSILHDVIISSGLDEEAFAHEGAVGLIGFDLLAGSIADLSFDAKTLHLMDPAKVAPDEKAGMVVRVDLSDGHMRTPMRINDKFDVIATLDSGNPADILFSRDLIERDRMSFLVQLNLIREGVSGSEIEGCGKLGSLSLGPVRYQGPEACASPSFARNEILVGLDFMHAFNFVFDYPDGIIVMIPRKAY